MDVQGDTLIKVPSGSETDENAPKAISVESEVSSESRFRLNINKDGSSKVVLEGDVNGTDALRADITFNQPGSYMKGQWISFVSAGAHLRFSGEGVYLQGGIYDVRAQIPTFEIGESGVVLELADHARWELAPPLHGSFNSGGLREGDNWLGRLIIDEGSEVVFSTRPVGSEPLQLAMDGIQGDGGRFVMPYQEGGRRACLPCGPAHCRGRTTSNSPT